MVTIRIPSPPRGLLSNLLGLAGLAAVVLAVGGVTGNWWWSVLTGGVFAVGLAVLAQYSPPAVEAADAPTQQLPRIGAA